MSEDAKKLSQKNWEIERKQKTKAFSELLIEKIDEVDFEILEYDFSDNFMINCEDYPNNKYEKKLYQEFEIEEENEVWKFLNLFMGKIEENFVYIFSYNFNFGLTKISKELISKNWKKILEIDEDEIMIFNPKNGKFLSLELTEDIMFAKQEKGLIKFYKLTFSEKKEETNT